MPKAKSDTEKIVDFFFTADLAAATSALETAKSILANRRKAAAPAGEVAAPKTRKPRQSKTAPAVNGAPAPAVDAPPPTPPADFI